MRQFASALNIGAIRASNQDQVLISHHDELDLMLVCDGMGGANAGDVASRMCVESLQQQFLNTSFLKKDVNTLKEWIVSALKQANLSVLQAALDQPNYFGMGTTAVMALCTKESIIIANVGDSRAYALKNEKLIQISQDHSLVNQWIQEGKMSVEEAKRHPQRSVLTNVLGVSEEMRIDLFECDINNDYLLICSDGVTGMLEDAQIEAIILKGGSTSQIAKRIEKAALSLGGYDNIALALMSEDHS